MGLVTCVLWVSNLLFSFVFNFMVNCGLLLKFWYCGKRLFFIFLSDTPTLVMLVNGKAFEGTVDYEVTDGQLRSCNGANTSCITEFRPVVFPYAQMVYKRLLALHNYHLCCFITGTYALLVAGRLDTFDGITIFIALNDHLYLCYIHQGPNLV